MRNSLRAHLKRQTPGAKSTPAHYRTTLTVPSAQERHRPVDRPKKLRSRTSAAEERYIKPRERGRGSFVLVKIKEPGPEGFLEEKYVRKLEENFRVNHLFGSLTVEVEEGMRTIVKQGQVREVQGA